MLKVDHAIVPAMGAARMMFALTASANLKARDHQHPRFGHLFDG